MKLIELLQHLQKYPDDTDVFYWSDDLECKCPIVLEDTVNISGKAAIIIGGDS
jgi:hypothetical protein